MKIFNPFKRVYQKFVNLETIEEKAFWLVGPFTILIGIASFFMVPNYDFIWTLIVLCFTCLILPLLLMIIVSKKKNYHISFFVLITLLGAVSAPLCLYFTGGFLGGNMLFCSLATGLTALCHLRKHRIIAFISSFLLNSTAFFVVCFYNNPLPMTEVSNLNELISGLNNPALSETYGNAVRAIGLDQYFTFCLSALGLYLVISLVTGNLRRIKINEDALVRYFDVEKRKEIISKAKNPEALVSSEHKKVVILFADISNFTSLTENMNPDLVSEFLNCFFKSAGNHIHETGGIIDKFIGDCIMAYWLDDSEDAVFRCAKSMLDLKKEILFNSEEIFNKYGVELNFSCGIASGDVIFGDIGSESMHDYTIIGDAVNIASRIQGYATSGEMLVSDSAAARLKDQIRIQKIESNHFFKGKNKPTDVYRILGYSDISKDDKVEVNNDFRYELHVCGCRGSFPVSGLRFSEYGGETSCYLIKDKDYALIVDCGTGLKNAVDLVKDCKDVDILLTHVHYDHILGLLMSKFPDTTNIKIYGRFDKWNNSKNGLGGFMERPYWPIKMEFKEKVTIELDKEIKLQHGMSATFTKADHPDDACVIKVMCGGKKIVFLADCEDATKINDSFAKDAEIVFFDGMFDDKDEIDHKGWGHGTWQAGVRYLEGRNIKKLVITHHSPENGDHTLMLKENEARDLAQNVSFAKSGDIFHF